MEIVRTMRHSISQHPKVFRFTRLHLSLAAIVATLASGSNAQSLSDAHMQELTETYCTECHNLDDYSGGLDLEALDNTRKEDAQSEDSEEFDLE
jgi:hypothetical protein